MLLYFGHRNLSKYYTTRQTHDRRCLPQIIHGIELFSLTHYRLSYYLLVAFVCACISGACKRVQSVVDNNKKRTAESAMLLKAALL